MLNMLFISRVRRVIKYFHKWEKISIFKVDNIEFSVEYFFYSFWKCFFQILDMRAIHDITSQ